MTYRSRIVGHGYEDPTQLLANPRNWRIHPKPQEDALAGVLSEVGWVQTVLVNKTTGFVVDGHLRVAHAISNGEDQVPVTYLDLDEWEEGVVLASFDPLASLAAPDQAKLDELIKELSVSDERLAALLEGMSSGDGPTDPLAEWQGMPDFENGQLAAREIVVRFRDEEAVARFGLTLGASITPMTKSIWFPERDRRETTNTAYVADDS